VTNLVNKRRPGRPPGPAPGRRWRPWDPRQLSFREFAILRHLAANPDLPRWRIAEQFGVSPARLSVLTCCPIGQAYLRVLAEMHEESGRSYEGLLHSEDEIREVMGPLALTRR
jgi:hypothetical protein